MGNIPSTSNWNRTFQIIKQKHDAAYCVIQEAISLEEQEMPHEAIEKYKAGILLIDSALDTPVTSQDNPDITWEQACVMIQKMKKTRAEVLMRINTITSSPTFIPNEPPPSYDEAISESDIPRTYTDLAAALNDLHIDFSNDEVAEIIYSHDGVRLYYISPDGNVAQTSEPEPLYIVAVTRHGDTSRTLFLQVGDFVYPLVAGVSPCYRTSFGAFILPDLNSAVPGSSIGIILPADADASVYDILESILFGVLGQEPTETQKLHRVTRTITIPPIAPQVAPGISTTISHGLVTGAYYISQGLITGAQKVGTLLNYGTPKLINTLSPASEQTTFSPKVMKGFEIVSSTSGAAANFTGYMATKVSSATQALGRYLAPHIQKQGTRLLTSSFNFSEHEASSTVNGVLTVAAGAVEGFSTIYEGLEHSASILGNNLSNNTVKVISHKYGSSAGHIAGDTFNTVGNVINITHNSKFFTPKGLVKTTAKQAGRAVLEDIAHNVQPTIAANGNFIYPNLQNIETSNYNNTELNLTSQKK